MDAMGLLISDEDPPESEVYCLMELIFYVIKLTYRNGANYGGVTFEAVNSGCDMEHMVRVVRGTLTNTAYPYVERRLRLYRTLEFSIRHATDWLASAESGDHDEDEATDEDEC